MNLLSSEFFTRLPLIVAPELLGKILIRNFKNFQITGRITEVEAYLATDDESAHGYRGETKRITSLFLDAGHAYVHRIHQQHCIDVVTEQKDTAVSLLIRALYPLSGLEEMKINRKKKNIQDLTSGLGKICQALKIDMTFDGVDMTRPDFQLQ